MPSQVLCAWCGRAVDVATVSAMTSAATAICQSCADWQKTRGSDEEDHLDAEGFGQMRPAPGPGVTRQP